MFNLWSENNNEAQKILRPDLGLRQWDSLSSEEKSLIWRHLDLYFFIIDRLKYDSDDYGHKFTNSSKHHHIFYNPDINAKRERIKYAIASITKKYKVKNYAKNFIKDYSHFSACADFLLIFTKAEGDAVLELLSFYCKAIILERTTFYREKNDKESLASYQSEKEKWQYEDFDSFAMDINEVFTDFGLNVHLTRAGFIPKQDNKIIENVFEPVLKFLADSKWNEVNSLLSDAFIKYRENSPSGYSSCVTHTVAATEAFLQILVKGKSGEGDFAGLVSEGQRKGLISSDFFTKEIFKSIISILMKERKETGDAHVKQSYATEKNAKMVLNLAMVFLQHCIIN